MDQSCLGPILVHVQHVWGHVGAKLAPSEALECHWVTQGAPNEVCSEVSGGRCWSMLVNVKGLRHGRGSAEGG